jgi:hypothetical protein
MPLARRPRDRGTNLTKTKKESIMKEMYYFSGGDEEDETELGY